MSRFWVLAIFMACMNISMFFLILSPYFGKEFAVPMYSVPCQNIAVSAHLAQGVVESSKVHECYRAEDVLALNRAMNISDTISMLGLLLAIFAFIAPVFSFLTLQKEKQDLKAEIEKIIKENHNALQKREDKFNRKVKANDVILKRELEGFVASYIQQYPTILSSIEVFKLVYQTDKPRGEKRCVTDAHRIAFELTSLLDSGVSAQGAFYTIAGYITESSVLKNKDHIVALKRVLRKLYDATFFDSDARKKSLLEFIQGTLKMSVGEFLGN